MKHVLTVSTFLLPGYLFAQVETVVQPDFSLPFEEVARETEVRNFNISDNLLVQEEALSTSSEDTITVTTEVGTTTIPLKIDEQIPEQARIDLEEVVAQINADYVEAETACTTGSWLANWWCRVTTWF